MKAVLGNKEYLIDRSQIKHYVDRGYDIHDEDDTIIEYGRGKTVPYDEYTKVASENRTLKEQVKVLSEENDGLRKQIPVDNFLEKDDKAKTPGKGRPKEETTG